jgi:hypothetical protein
MFHVAGYMADGSAVCCWHHPGEYRNAPLSGKGGGRSTGSVFHPMVGPRTDQPKAYPVSVWEANVTLDPTWSVDGPGVVSALLLGTTRYVKTKKLKCCGKGQSGISRLLGGAAGSCALWVLDAGAHWLADRFRAGCHDRRRTIQCLAYCGEQRAILGTVLVSELVGVYVGSGIIIRHV